MRTIKSWFNMHSTVAIVHTKVAAANQCDVPNESGTNCSARDSKYLAVSLTQTFGTPMAAHQRNIVSAVSTNRVHSRRLQPNIS